MISVALQGMPVDLHYSIINLDLIAQVGRATLANALNEDPRELLCKRESKIFIPDSYECYSTDLLASTAALWLARILRIHILSALACFQKHVGEHFLRDIRAPITFLANVSSDSDPEAVSVLREIDLEALHLWQWINVEGLHGEHGEVLELHRKWHRRYNWHRSNWHWVAYHVHDETGSCLRGEKYFSVPFFDDGDVTRREKRTGMESRPRRWTRKRDTTSPVRHSRAFQCRTPASTCNRCRSWNRPSARVACCSSPARCAPGVCPARPDPPGFSLVRSGRDFREPESIPGTRKFYASQRRLRLEPFPDPRIYRDERARFLCRATSVFSGILNFQPCGNFNLSE